MKGLLVSLAVFAVYAAVVTLLSRVLRVERHSKLFFPAIAAMTPVYFLTYHFIPANFWILPRSWMASTTWVDVTYGYVVFLLNCHSFIDFFFGLNGGFSMSLMLEIFRAGDRGLKTEELIAKYFTTDGMDKLYGWRLPRLEATGYMTVDQESGTARLTPKGRSVANLTLFLKRLMNLGEEDKGMEQGIIMAILLSVAWIAVQNLVMHLRQAENCFMAMLAGYLASLPLVYAAWRWLPHFPMLHASGGEAPAMGLFHAYFFHLLLFLLYVELFYHVERSVTLRFLIEIMKHEPQSPLLDDVRRLYNVREMITRRLEVLRDNDFVAQRDSAWHLRPKGALFARVMQLSHWVFQSKSQHERM